MESQTILANRIDAAGTMISYDNACKRVLANKVILAWIIKTCIQDFNSIDISEISEKYIEGEPVISEEAVHMDETAEFIQGMNTESMSITEAALAFDIKFRALRPNAEDMIIDVEAQNKYSPGYPLVKRGVYYSGRMISEQYGTVFKKSHYQKIRKVASIWICTNPPNYRKNTISAYTVQKDSLVGDVHEDQDNYDLIAVVIICLGGKGDRYSGLLRLLDVLLSPELSSVDKKRILQEEFKIPMTRKLEGDVEAMCNLSTGVYNNGYNSGFDKAVVGNIIKLQKAENWDIEHCMNALGVPADKREEYKKMIEGETARA